MGVCYVIAHTQTNLVKIGITEDWQRRAKELKIGSKTELLHQWQTIWYEELERDLHAVFANKRLPQSEWFNIKSYQAKYQGNKILNGYNVEHTENLHANSYEEEAAYIYDQLKQELESKKNLEDQNDINAVTQEVQQAEETEQFFDTTEETSHLYQRNALIIIASLTIAISLLFTDFYSTFLVWSLFAGLGVLIWQAVKYWYITGPVVIAGLIGLSLLN